MSNSWDIVGIAFELPFISYAERRTAAALRRFVGHQLRDLRSLRAAVEEIVAPAGLEVGSGGSHIHICRKKDCDADRSRPKPPYRTEDRDPVVSYRSPLHIDRWAIICDRDVAASWAESAAKKFSNQPIN